MAFFDDPTRWQRRLAREEPFFTRIFEQHGVRRVLDVACGTGRHSVRLAERGYQVTGVDINPDSLEWARAHAVERGVGVPFLEGSYLQLSQATPGPFDALYCVGNSLSLCESEGEVLQVLREFLAVLRPGGVAIGQILNYVGIAEREEELDYVRSFVRDGVEHVVVKFFRFGGPRWEAEFVSLKKEGDIWQAELGGLPLLALDAATYAELWQKAGFEDIELFGDYQATPFDVHTARDAITLATKPAQSRAR